MLGREKVHHSKMVKEMPITTRISYTRYGSYWGKREVEVTTTVRKRLGAYRPWFVYEIWWLTTMDWNMPDGIMMVGKGVLVGLGGLMLGFVSKKRPNLGKELVFSALCWYTGLGR